MGLQIGLPDIAGLLTGGHPHAFIVFRALFFFVPMNHSWETQPHKGFTKKKFLKNARIFEKSIDIGV